MFKEWSYLSHFTDLFSFLEGTFRMRRSNVDGNDEENRVTILWLWKICSCVHALTADYNRGPEYFSCKIV